MCGISGLISNKYDLEGKAFYNATNKISHRGPDDEGYFYISKNNTSLNAKGKITVKEYKFLPDIRTVVNARCIFGHRRLSIIDLGANGHQPFVKNGFALTYNGEIFNYLELRKELESKGCIFETDTDTEVFITAYSVWGDKAFSKFNGMWAAAIYDIKNNTVTLTRDRFGIKPLYFCKFENKLYFSSEIKFFRPYSLLQKENEEIVYNYLRYAITDFDDRTFFSNIFQVEPGQYIHYDNKLKINKNYFWKTSDLGGIKYPQDNLDKILTDSIKLRLRSDVGVGSLLSGGIDSSLIVGIIKENLKIRCFNTFSAVFKNEPVSEKKYIDKTVKKLRIKPNYVYPNTKDFKSKITKLIEVQEMPFRSLSVLSQFSIYEYVSKHSKIKVLLNGQGADEIFSGYTNHLAIYLINLITNFKFIAFFQEIKKLKKRNNLQYSKLIKWVLKVLISSLFDTGDKYKISKNKFKNFKKFKKIPNKSFFKSYLIHGLQKTALREYLRYEDRNSMYFGLEARLPFLDYRLVKLSFSLKDKELLSDAVTKVPLRKMANKLLPEEVTNRIDKAGFPSPQEKWQKAQLKTHFDEIFKEIEVKGIFEFLNTENILKIYKDYTSNKNEDWSFIWRVYCLFQWKKKWLNYRKTSI